MPRSEYMKKYMREYYQRHADEIKAKRREYYQRHADEIKAKQREYYQRHADEIKAKRREYRQRPDVKAKQRVCKKGNAKNIKRICIDYGLSEDVADIIALDGDVLDKEMKKRGII